jgi:hypothetical protein
MKMVLALSTGFRAAAPANVVLEQLYSLADLSGTWVGNGFSLVSLPDFEHGAPFRLMLNATKEILTFEPIGAPIPNRGSGQKDIRFLGLHYFQQVSDNQSNQALHLEPGLWLTIPDTSVPKQKETIIRLSTIPHGNAMFAQGASLSCHEGGPTIGAVDAIPFTIDPLTGERQDVTDPQYLGPFLSNKDIPPGIPLCATVNPNLVLVEALRKFPKGRRICRTLELSVAATPVGDIAAELMQRVCPKALLAEQKIGGILNIPFLVANANATGFAGTFWIETVKNSDGSEFVQLQYSQTVILDFGDLKWPHITVATLVQQ